MRGDHDIQERLRALWQGVLDEPGEIRADSDFFRLGGHSMNGARLMARVCVEFDADLPLELIFREPVFGRFVARVRDLLQDRTAGADGHATATGATEAPLTAQQRALMAVEQLFGTSPANTVTVAVELGLRPDPAVLTAALQSVVDRHPALRTVFPGGAAADRQTVRPPGDLRVAVEIADVSGRDVRREVIRGHLVPFDLVTGPLVRGRLLLRGTDAPILVLHLHHLIADGTSVAIVSADLAAAYGAPPAGPGAGAGSYLDYAVRQAARETELRRASAGYWRTVVRDLVTDPARALVPLSPLSARFVRGAVRLGADEAAALRGWARGHGATDFAVAVAAAAAAVHRHTGARTVGLGTLLENRSDPAFRRSVGAFATSSLFAVAIGDTTTPGDLVTAVAAQVDTLRQWADLPLELLVEAHAADLDVTPSDLVDLVITIEHEAAPAGTGLPMRQIADRARTLLPGVPGRLRNLVVRPLRGGELELVAEYADDPAESEWVSGLLGEIEAGLARFTRYPDRPVAAPWTAGRAG
jgi:hypothetical protein